MTKIQKKLFTLRDSWPWAAVLLVFVATTIKAFAFNWSTLNSTSAIQLFILTIATLAAAFIVGYRYDNLWCFVHRWNRSYQTPQGCAIIPNIAAYAAIRASGWYKDIEWGADSTEENPLYKRIAAEINSCCSFWGANSSILSGATISIVDKPFYVKFIGKVMGVQEGHVMQVAFDQDRVKTEEQLLMLIRHEVSHLCLSSRGVPVDQQHSVMRGFC